MSDELRLRRYEPRDQEQVLTLERKALEAVDARPDEEDWADDLREIPTTYLDAGGEFLVGELDGGESGDERVSRSDEAASRNDEASRDDEPPREIIAMGGLKRVDATTAEVTRMRVTPDHHRRGFGEAVLLALEDRAADFGYERMKLETTARQEAAQLLYEKHGYERVGRWTYGQFDMLTYRKNITPTRSSARSRGS